ncbi:MAG TPA: TIGR00282 family metallophosphoesterase [Pirellulaceae bacterium]|nr:TIGR00282 family metallophosphoesterase [Pirellulaceae bacterium]
MRILLIGDIVGKPGRRIVVQALAGLRKRESLDLVIANAENSADGSGITPAIYRELINAGVDCITLGDHIYRRREINTVLDSEPNIVKPANYPAAAPGKSWAVVQSASGVPVFVTSLMGRVFMRPVDCPWTAADQVLTLKPAEVKVAIVDFHAEATSDKQLMGRYLDGRVSAVLGTHTHVPTADEHVQANGTAFQCDVGMTGPHDSILGRKVECVLETTLTFNPTHFEVATKDVRINGAIVDVDPLTGCALSIRRLCVREDELPALKQLVTTDQASLSNRGPLIL